MGVTYLKMLFSEPVTSIGSAIVDRPEKHIRLPSEASHFPFLGSVVPGLRNNGPTFRAVIGFRRIYRGKPSINLLLEPLACEAGSA
jgi:hypothetical protein